MMVEKVFEWLRLSGEPRQRQEAIEQKARERMELEDRERRARRMNDALENMVHVMRRDNRP